MREALKAKVTAAAAPKAAARHHRGPNRAPTTDATMTAATAVEATSHPVADGFRSPPWGSATTKKAPSPATTAADPGALPPAQPVVEGDDEDGLEEEQLGGEHGLDHAQLPEPQGHGLEDEGERQQGQAQQPDPPAQGVGDQAEAHGRLGRGRLDPHPLEDGGDGVHERRRGGEEVGDDPSSSPPPAGSEADGRPDGPTAGGAGGGRGTLGEEPAAGRPPQGGAVR